MSSAVALGGLYSKEKMNKIIGWLLAYFVYVNLEVPVKTGVNYQVVCQPDAMGFHRMARAVVIIPNVR